ncbi:MAG: M28 family metallopeptidase [Kiritimatiellia bacterium]
MGQNLFNLSLLAVQSSLRELLTFPLAFLILAGLMCLICACRPAANAQKPTAPLPPIPFAAANGSNALQRVTALCDLGPRDAGTPGAERAAQWLAAELRRDGLTPRIETFTNDTPSGPLTCHNVLATVPCAHVGEAEQKDNWIVLLSHFDTKSGISPAFIGANDGGSSSALLLELARVMRGTPLRNCHVLFGFLDGEECRVQYGPRDGFHGSRHLAAQFAVEKPQIRAVILLDMVGDRSLSITLPSNGTPHLTMLALQAAKTVGARDKFQLADGRILDDHQAFLDAGFPAVDLIDFAYGSAPGLNDYWHTVDDTPDKLSAASLTIVGQVVAEMLRHLDAE